VQPDPAATSPAPQSLSRACPSRVARACLLTDLEQHRRLGGSVRAFAARAEVPRSPLQDSLRAAQDDGLPAAWSHFFESDDGVLFARRLLVVLLVLLVLRGGCSVERIAECFEAMHLRRYLAASPTSLRRTLDRVLQHVNAWGQQQFERLAPDMPRRDVLLAVDENFHWDKILLGSIDVVTGFVFGERMSDARDGRTWTAAVRESLAGHNVCLRAITRDGARAFDTCAQALGVPAGPDLFHLQHAVCKTTALPMASRARRAADAAAKRRAARGAHRTGRHAWRGHSTRLRGPRRTPARCSRSARRCARRCGRWATPTTRRT